MTKIHSTERAEEAVNTTPVEELGPVRAQLSLLMIARRLGEIKDHNEPVDREELAPLIARATELYEHLLELAPNDPEVQATLDAFMGKRKS